MCSVQYLFCALSLLPDMLGGMGTREGRLGTRVGKNGDEEWKNEDKGWNGDTPTVKVV